jgi:hypothetical protein
MAREVGPAHGAPCACEGMLAAPSIPHWEQDPVYDCQIGRNCPIPCAKKRPPITVSVSVAMLL